MRLYYTGTQPTRAHHDDAGLDLYVKTPTTIQPHTMEDIDLGTAIKTPPGTWALLTGRSSTMRNRGLLIAQGIIDTGYTGPLYATTYNLTDKPVHINAGDRIAQIIILPNLTQRTTLEHTTTLEQTTRGKNGFGSSGL